MGGKINVGVVDLGIVPTPLQFEQHDKSDCSIDS